jgi:glutathione S-transferase
MKLYDTPMAPNPRRVRWLMAEKGIADIELVPMNLIQGSHQAPDFLAKAGLPLLPALELDDGSMLTESIAICRYLDALYPEPNLFGRTPLETATVEMWMRRAEMLVAVPFMLGVRHTHPAMAALETQDAHVGEYNTGQGVAGLKVLDRRLGETEWLAGNRLTIADIVGFIGIDFTRMIRLTIPADLANVQRWASAMRARPAAAA